MRRGFLQKLYEQTQVQPGSSKVWKLVCALESRLAMFALRMGLAHDILAANVVLRRKVSGGVDSGGVLPPEKCELSVEHYLSLGDTLLLRSVRNLCVNVL